MEEFKNKKTIIVGDVNTGKTTYLLEILDGFIDLGEKDLTVIDMAPESVKGIGGKMSGAESKEIRYFTTKIIAPRLTGKTVGEVEKLARQNVKMIDDIIFNYRKNPGNVLFINDISIYLQAGDLHKLLLLLHSTPTVIMNGYYGIRLGGGELGKRERDNMEALQERCDRVITV